MEALMLTNDDYIFVGNTNVGVRLEVPTKSLHRIVNHYDSFAKVGKLGLTDRQVIFSDIGFTTHPTKEDYWIADFFIPAYFTNTLEPVDIH